LASAGLGFAWEKISLDIAGQYQQELGYSGILSIQIITLTK
jgi:hypothetical protein